MNHKYVRIPAVSFGPTGYKIATFSVPDGFLEFYWWFERRNVIVHKVDCGVSEWGIWNGGGGATIPQMICAALSVREVSVSALFEHDGARAKAFSDEMAASFPSCEWSDYACDRMVISGSVAIRRNRARSSSFDGNDPSKDCHDFGAGFEMS
jgi:hypothetical protein